MYHKSMDNVRLTNGNETFLLGSVASDNLGAAVHGKDSRGAGYTRCDTPTCDHHTDSLHDEAQVVFWHDDENTETLWEVTK